MSKMSDPASELDVDLDVDFFVLPKGFFPDAWDDDVRMNVLMAPFRVKSINPQNYESKLNFWRNLITKYCDQKGSAQVTVTELRCAFKRNGGRPHGLATVFDEMKQSKQTQTRNEFLQIPSETWSGWAANMVSNSLKWGFNQLKNPITSPSTSNECQYIILEAVKKHAERLQAKFSKENIVTKEDLYNNLDGINVSADGVELALHYLILQQKAAVEEFESVEKKITIIKIVEGNNSIKCIDKADRSMFELKIAENSLQKTIDDLETKVNEYEEVARDYVQNGKRNLAKNYLKKKIILMRQLDHKSKTLEHIQSIIMELDNTSQNAKILGAFKSGNEALKSTLANSGITPEKVDDVMADLKETLETNEDIQMAFDINIGSSAADDDSLEQELLELETAAAAASNNQLDESIERRLNELKINDGALRSLLNGSTSKVSPPAAAASPAI